MIFTAVLCGHYASHAMKTLKYIAVLTASLVFAAGCWAQTSDDSKPATTNVRAAEYPRIHSDLSVTFRVKAPTAQKVQLDLPPAGGAPSGLGAGPVDMKRDKDGYWSVTIPPGVPGFHYYSILIDGVPCQRPIERNLLRL